MNIEERNTPSEVPAPELASKPKRPPLGVWRILLLVVAAALVCAFALSKSGILERLAGSSPSGLVNVNTASMEDLKELPDINKKTAEAMVSGRPFKTLEELLKVKGIGEKKLEKLRPLITLE